MNSSPEQLSNEMFLGGELSDEEMLLEGELSDEDLKQIAGGMTSANMETSVPLSTHSTHKHSISLARV